MKLYLDDDFNIVDKKDATYIKVITDNEVTFYRYTKDGDVFRRLANEVIEDTND